MAQYREEDADEVFQHVYFTLKAAINFLDIMKKENPQGARWYVRHSALEKRLRKLMDVLLYSMPWFRGEITDGWTRLEGLHALKKAGADVAKILRTDSEIEMKKLRELDARISELPAGWPLDYPQP